jgi:hypothetical protein
LSGVSEVDGMKAPTKMIEVEIVTEAESVKEIEIVLTVVDLVILREIAENQDEIKDVVVLHLDLDQKDEGDLTLAVEVEEEGQGHIVETGEVEVEEIEDQAADALIAEGEIEVEIEEILVIEEDQIAEAVEHPNEEENAQIVAKDLSAGVNLILEIAKEVEVEAKEDHKVNLGNNHKVKKEVILEVVEKEVEVHKKIKDPLPEVPIEELEKKITGNKMNRNKVVDHLPRDILKIGNLKQINRSRHHKKVMEIMMDPEILKTF